METQLTTKKPHTTINTHIHTHTRCLAKAFIDWTTGQREDTKIGEDLPKPFSIQAQQPPTVRREEDTQPPRRLAPFFLHFSA